MLVIGVLRLRSGRFHPTFPTSSGQLHLVPAPSMPLEIVACLPQSTAWVFPLSSAGSVYKKTGKMRAFHSPLRHRLHKSLKLFAV